MPDWPHGNSELARLIRERDWAATPLGAVATWPDRLRAIVELVLASPTVTSLALTEQRLLIYNDAAARLYGERHPEALGRPLPEIFPKSYPTVAPLYDRVFAGESVSVQAQPLSVGTNDGEDVFDAFLTPVWDAHGAVIGAHMTGIETGARSRAEALLRNSEERFRAFVMASSDVVYRMSADWSEMRELDGRGFLADTRETDRDWMERYIHPDDRARVRAAIDEAIASRTIFALEHRVVQSDGSLGWTASRAVPILDGEGEIVEWLGTASDVTERRQLEVRMGTLLAQAPMAIALTGPGGEIQFRNAMFDRLWGRQPHDTTARTYSDVYEGYHPDGRPIASEEWPGARAVLNGETVSGEVLEIVDLQGRRVPCSFHAGPIRDMGDKVVGAVVMFRDLTDEIAAKRALEESETLRRIAQASGRMGSWRWDLAERTVEGDAEFLALWGFPPSSEPVPLSMFTERQSSSGNAQTEAVVTRAIMAGEEFDADIEVASGPTAGKWLRWRGRAAPGNPSVLYGVSFDITDQVVADVKLRESEANLRLLVAELQHRVRNILTVVRLTFDRTFEREGNSDELAMHFRGRLDAMSRTQVALTRHIDRTAPLEDLIRDELLSVGARADDGFITLDGPEVELDQKTAESLAMALHELTTNALKYGALSTKGAFLTITWRFNSGEGQARTLDLFWSEQGVPAIDLKPARRGFGLELIEEALPYRLGAETKLEFRGGGVRCSISVPFGTGEQGSSPDVERTTP